MRCRVVHKRRYAFVTSVEPGDAVVDATTELEVAFAAARRVPIEVYLRDTGGIERTGARRSGAYVSLSFGWC